MLPNVIISYMVIIYIALSTRKIRAFLKSPILMESSLGLLNADYCLSLNKLNKAKQTRTEISKLRIKVTRNSIIKIIVSPRFRTFHVRTSLNSISSSSLRGGSRENENLTIWLDKSNWISLYQVLNSKDFQLRLAWKWIHFQWWFQQVFLLVSDNRLSNRLHYQRFESIRHVQIDLVYFDRWTSENDVFGVEIRISTTDQTVRWSLMSIMSICLQFRIDKKRAYMVFAKERIPEGRQGSFPIWDTVSTHRKIAFFIESKVDILILSGLIFKKESSVYFYFQQGFKDWSYTVRQSKSDMNPYLHHRFHQCKW